MTAHWLFLDHLPIPDPSLQLRGSRVLTLASPLLHQPGEMPGRDGAGGVEGAGGTCFQKKNEWKLEEGNTKCCLYGTVK